MTNLPPSPFLQSVGVGSTTDEPAAVLHPPADAAAGSPIPPGYVLVERTVLERLAIALARIKAYRERRMADMPTFIGNPSWEYLDAVQRGAR